MNGGGDEGMYPDDASELGDGLREMSAEGGKRRGKGWEMTRSSSATGSGMSAKIASISESRSNTRPFVVVVVVFHLDLDGLSSFRRAGEPDGIGESGPEKRGPESGL